MTIDNYSNILQVSKQMPRLFNQISLALLRVAKGFVKPIMLHANPSGQGAPTVQWLRFTAATISCMCQRMDCRL